MNTLRILAITDLHIGKFWKDKEGNLKPFQDSEAILERIREIANGDNPPELLTIGGDIVDGDTSVETIRDFFQRLGAINIPYLCCAGNNDVEWLAKNIDKFTDDTNFQAGARLDPEGGWNVLVQEWMGKPPARFSKDGEVHFISMMGWYDGTLWQTLEQATDAIPLDQDDSVGKFPASQEAVDSAMRDWFVKERENGHTQFSIASNDPIDYTEALWAHLESTAQGHTFSTGRKHVLLTHFIPAEGFVSSRTEKFRNLNAYMGSDQSERIARMKTSAGLIGVLCGHTHRDCEVEFAGVPIVNPSGFNQPKIIEFSY